MWQIQSQLIKVQQNDQYELQITLQKMIDIIDNIAHEKTLSKDVKYEEILSEDVRHEKTLSKNIRHKEIIIDDDL